jgi:hypothetical protein
MARETNNYAVILYSACLDQGVWSGKKLQLIGWEMLLQCKFLHTCSEVFISWIHYCWQTWILGFSEIFSSCQYDLLWSFLILPEWLNWTQTLQFIAQDVGNNWPYQGYVYVFFCMWEGSVSWLKGSLFAFKGFRASSWLCPIQFGILLWDTWICLLLTQSDIIQPCMCYRSK